MNTIHKILLMVKIKIDSISYFLQEKPGAYAFIGNGNSASLHNPSYDFNDDNLPIGASFLARIAENKLL